MYVSITGNKGNQDVYIKQSYRKDNGKTSSRIYKKLGKYNALLEHFSGNEQDLMDWAKKEAEKETLAYNQQKEKVSLSLSPLARIPLDEERVFNIGYLFLQKICSELRMHNICRNIRNHHKFAYDFHAILTDLIYARILAPSSKLSSYKYCHSLLEPPKYSLQDLYRALSVLAEESDFIQEELYKNSNFVHPRNSKILYYDCTNYYFEIEAEDGMKKYGKSKEHRPNPIVTMGLFMDADGIPLAFDIFPGNQNEQLTLKPIEQKVIKDFNCSEFIFCSDAGLAGKKNRFLNSFGNRSYVITYSLKKMKKEERDFALLPTQFKVPGSNKLIDLRTLDESDPEVYNTIYYKEYPLVTGDMDETVIITYSPKYKAYQSKIRNAQIDRAKKRILSSDKNRKGKGPNDPTRFIQKTAITDDGEIAQKNIYQLDESKILEESMYDGFYAVITNLEGDVREIIHINKQRWEIEENFRIMKSEFEARPVFVRREDRIKAHFLTCFISLLVYRLLEKKLGEQFTCNQILETLRNMNVTLLSKDSGYIPSYKRTKLTDNLHNSFGFRTDYEFMRKSTMRTIIKETKAKK
ncbi:IS1634 family transposase [Faecalicatena acetigenes]|uniref:IS1634 family transposase n=2 Tax=Lachnospiraceae TaxID=186803 RepID=A0ABT2T7P0_9FIRM|nr:MULTISPECIES: IS1634 family transposase [Lachnospiraceae]MCU6746282.1 IS1634 family transposase [Faecalicatena acetigenes]SCH05304.1 Transposase [uncultured Clostridium sp.]